MATLDEMRRSLIAAHNSGDTITARKLALSIKLMESQPMGAVPVAQPLGYRSQAVRRPLTVGERVQEFGAGVGRGLETQLGGIRAIGERFSQLQQESAEQPGSPLQAMVFRPAAQLGREFLAGIEPYVRDPGKIVEAGQEMASKAASGPQQAGQVFGEMVDPRGLMAALKTPPVAELTTYHGTPHVFAPEEGAPLGRFRASQIGTGEGAQAYGHGIYLAEAPGVAKGYRNVLSNTLEVVGDAPALEKRAAQMALTFGDNTPEGAVQWLSKYEQKGAGHTAPALTPELVKAVKEKFENGTFKQGGSLYTVDLPDPMVERMLDWDKPLSEQPESVRKAFETAMRDAGVQSYKTPEGTRVYLEVGSEDALRGRDVYRRLMDDSREGAIMSGRNADTTLAASQAAASDYLRSLGIPGIRYFDAGSRDSAKGTRNFVIFPGEEQNLTILKRE